MFTLFVVDLADTSNQYSVPVRVSNHGTDSGRPGNPHVTTFFYIDTQLGRAAGGELKVVQYLADVQLVVTQWSDAEDRMFIPELRVRCAAQMFAPSGQRSTCSVASL
jgi:hypothetical protein